MNTQEELLHTIISSMDNLPEVPSVALRVNALLSNPETDTQEVADIILNDPALTAQILKICNSAEYGFSRKISTIREAVSILGFNVLKRVIITIISHSLLNRPVEGYALDKGELWENAITCGAYARYIANKYRFEDPELALTGALLRDIGKVAMESFIRDKREALEQLAINHKCTFAEAEEQVLGLSHTVVGAALADRWNLPQSLECVITYHHQPAKVPKNVNHNDKLLVSIVHVADSYTMMTGTGVGVDGLMYDLDADALSLIGIKGEDQKAVDGLFAELLDLREEINTLSKTLSNN